jgi:hypothetical protein
LFRLDFSEPGERSKNVAKMVRTIRGMGDRFTGHRWYKGLNITNLGAPVGTGPVAQKASLGQSYEMIWENGVVVRVNVYTDGVLTNYKEFGFDADGRVVENRMYTPDGHGGWALVKDVWTYVYDPQSGIRLTKTMRYPGEHTARRAHYDSAGRAIYEEVITDPGFPIDRDFGYASKEFSYDAEGNPEGAHWFDANGAEVPEPPALPD